MSFHKAWCLCQIISISNLKIREITSSYGNIGNVADLTKLLLTKSNFYHDRSIVIDCEYLEYKLMCTHLV